jgi:heat shock protein 5
LGQLHRRRTAVRACGTITPTPSIHASSSHSVGDAAKNAFHTNPEHTVFDTKRLIGRKFDDNEVQRDMKHWPFKLTNKGGKPTIQVKHRGELRDFVSARPLF